MQRLFVISVKHSLFHFTDQSDDRLHFEKSLWGNGLSRIAGTDEVGRGPLAGPVVAASVVLPQNCNPSLLQDSKKLSHKKRVFALDYLQSIDAEVSIGIVDHHTIDSINILQASLLAMKLSLEKIEKSFGEPDFVLVDGKFEVPYPVSQTTLIKGDSRSASIAAASIVAKEKRDGIMASMHSEYPQYNFIKNQGYPTREHREAIIKYGPCPYHRTSFNGVKQFVSKK